MKRLLVAGVAFLLVSGCTNEPAPSTHPVSATPAPRLETLLSPTLKSKLQKANFTFVTRYWAWCPPPVQENGPAKCYNETWRHGRLILGLRSESTEVLSYFVKHPLKDHVGIVWFPPEQTMLDDMPWRNFRELEKASATVFNGSALQQGTHVKHVGEPAGWNGFYRSM